MALITPSAMRRFSTAVTITDPLVKYQAMVSSGVCSPDPAQHRLARHLHKIYIRIKDYSPQIEYRQRLSQATRLTQTEEKPPEDETGEGILALRHHAIWRNPLFKHLLPSAESRDSLALTRVLSSYETAIEIDSPKGLFLSGEVGTGKSMLLDLLAEGLPTEKKKRWHFNTFMLHTISQLERHRESNLQNSHTVPEHSLIWMAKKLVDESPILFLDEFQLPDRAASKILSNLFIAFFQLGGVLVASSNRMPDELEKASGIDYTPSSSQGFMGKIFGNLSRRKGELYGQTSDFASVLKVLKARCDFWQMEGAQDWRRREQDTSSSATSVTKTSNSSSASGGENATSTDETETELRKKPLFYHLTNDDDESFNQQIQDAVTWASLEPVHWQPSTLIVYGRKVLTPKHYNGFVFWSFNDLVDSFGPADYITMASSYHTFIIDQVPILTILAKNEARRFITLLDALYEARCKLIIRAENLPDDLFFPAAAVSSPQDPDETDNSAGSDATYSETIAEVYQDQISPFRPNVSYYDTQSSTSKYDPDQDSYFGLQNRPVDFANTGAFTGEDERFAYKRATSRLWELCSARWHARTGDWWKPLPAEARHWEGGAPSKPYEGAVMERSSGSAEKVGESIEIEEVAGLAKWRVEELKQQNNVELK